MVVVIGRYERGSCECGRAFLVDANCLEEMYAMRTGCLVCPLSRSFWQDCLDETFA